MRLTHIDLFSGIGGFALAAQWAGFETVQFVEIEPYPQRVLRKNFPGVPIHDDIRTFDAHALHDGGFWHVRWKEFEDMKKLAKYDDAPKLYYELGSVEATAEKYGVTRQAMYDVLKRRGVRFYSQLRFGEHNHFYRGGATAEDRAHNAVEKAVASGKLVRPSTCERCGHAPKPFADGRTAIQAHHDDYTKPLEVRWLCQKCHHLTHKEICSKEVTTQEAPVQVTLVTGGFP